MTITINGETTELVTEVSVRTLLGEFGYPDQGIAVAIDGEVVPRVRWDRAVADGAQIEIVTAVQGG